MERQQAELERLRGEIERLREENNQLKGQPKKPEQKAKKEKEGKDYSSQKERQEPKQGRQKRRKNQAIKIDREEILKVEREQLPTDAQFKGHEEVSVQDIKVETDNVRFRKEKWYSPSEGKTYLAPLPVGYEGQFGPRLKAWVVVLAFALNVTEAKIKDFLETAGISISSGQIAAIIKQEVGRLEPEKEAVYEDLPQLGPKQSKWVLEAAGIAAYHRQEEWPVIERLVCDDAGQFKRIVSEQALCWVHEGRHYKKLCPMVGYHQQQVEMFRGKFRQVLAYRQQPTWAEKERLSQEFETLFATETGYEDLDERIAKTKAKKEALLRVLDHPELPLHNNEAELGARQRKPKENISFGPRTTTGAKGWDIALTVAATARKLGVNIFAYLHDRVGQLYQMPSLADLISQRAAKDQAASSGQPQPP